MHSRSCEEGVFRVGGDQGTRKEKGVRHWCAGGFVQICDCTWKVKACASDLINLINRCELLDAIIHAMSRFGVVQSNHHQISIKSKRILNRIDHQIPVNIAEAIQDDSQHRPNLLHSG